MRNLINGISLLILISVFTNCKKSESSINLQGEWQEVEDTTLLNLGGNTYYYKFGCNNEFQLTISNWTDAANPDADSCSQWSWKEYASGKYEIQKNMLIMYGSYTDSLFEPISKGCYNVGNAQWNFEIIYNINGISLKSLNGNRYPDYNRVFKIRKTKNIRCD